MKRIGLKRLIILAVLLGLNAGIAAAFFLWIEPMRTEAAATVTRMEGEIKDLQTKITNIKFEIKEFERLKPKYEELHQQGFFLNQDRFGINRDLEGVRVKSGVRKFAFSVENVREIESKEAELAKMRLIGSRIELSKIDALLDTDFFHLIETMMQEFPSHIRLDSFQLSRAAPLNEKTMERLAETGGNMSLIEARAYFDWVTIVPREEDKPAASNKKGGRR